GIPDPMPVAATFGWFFDDGTRLADIAPFDTMVTLVDASQFLDLLASGRALADADRQATPDDERTVSDLLVDQVEFADLVLVTKTDLIDEHVARATEDAIRAMNPRARTMASPTARSARTSSSTRGFTTKPPPRPTTATPRNSSTRTRRRRRSTGFPPSSSAVTGPSTGSG